MPRFPSLPRVSIVVPVGDVLSDFETSLVSVLEHLPADAEVIVTHDGSYDDPFDLAEEVRFASTGSSDWGDLIRVIGSEARGRFVHLIGGGVRATDGWTAAGIEPFDDPEVGMIASVLRSERGEIVSVGWRDTEARLGEPVLAGSDRFDRRLAARAMAPSLFASFWRRETLRGLSGRYRGSDVGEAEYALGKLARLDGWRCEVAADCETRLEGDLLATDRPAFRRGQTRRAIHQRLHGGSWADALLAAGRGVLAAAIGRGGFGEALGQAAAIRVAADIKARVKPNAVESLPAERIVPIGHRGRSPVRRAA